MADDSFNVMQAQLGLYGSGNSSFGIPTPAPHVRHPGEVSQDASQQTQTASFQTLQSAMMTRPSSMGGFPSMGGGMFGTPTGPFGSPVGSVGAYARMYQQNMTSMNSQMFNPYVAQTMAGMGGMQGFSSGMLPSPIHMTSPNMGIFRPFPQGPMPAIPPTPQMPLAPMPWTPRPVTPHFSTPFDYNWQISQQRSMQYEAGFMAAPGVAGRGGVDAGFALGGAGLGANLGARLAGVGGARMGGILGAAGGLALSEMGGLGRTAQHMLDDINPLRTMALRTAQMRGITPEFVVGGSELSLDGRGLSSGGSRHLARRLEDTGWDSNFRRQTGNQFNVQDLTRMTHMAGEQGLLDMTQGSEQIAGRMKSIAKSVRMLMQVAGEPDVQEAVRQLGQMNQMGLSLSEMGNIVQNARMYARMAGTSVKGIMEAGLAGAATFQGQGLTAGLGLNVGMGAMGMARQAVAAGTYTPQQLAMYGGVQGIAQREMMNQAATLKNPMMAAAMSSFGGGGTFGLNGSAMGGMRAGNFDIHQMTTMGATNLLNAVNKGGVGALGVFAAQENLLQDAVGRELGPIGLKVQDIKMIRNTQRFMGLGNSPQDFVTAAIAMGKDPKEAMRVAQEASNPSFYSGLSRQVEVDRFNGRSSALQNYREGERGIVERNARGGGVLSGLYHGAGNFGTGFRQSMEDAGNFFTQLSENSAARDMGQAVVRTPLSLVATSPEQERAMYAMGHETFQAQQDRISARGAGGAISNFSLFGRDGASMSLSQLRHAQGGRIFESEFFERLGRTGSLTDSEKAEASDFRNTGHTLSEGLGLSAEGKASLDAQLYRAIAPDYDKLSDTEKARVREKVGRVKADISRGLVEQAKGNNNLIGDDTSMHGLKGIAGQALEREGIDTAHAGAFGKASAQMAEAAVKTATGSGFKLSDVQDVQSVTDRINKATNDQDSTLTEAFGKSNAFWASGEKMKRKRAMDMLSEYSPDAAAVAVLAAKGDVDGIGRYLADLPEREAGAIETVGYELRNKLDAEGLLEVAGQLGGQLASKGSAKAQKATMTKTTNNWLVSKKSGAYAKGLQKIFAKNSSLAEVGATGSAKILELDDSKLADAPEKVKELAKQYKRAKTKGEKNQIAAEFDNYAAGQGSGADSMFGGTLDGRNESKANTAQAGISATRGDALKSFPGAVDTFKRASELIVQRLSNDGPSLPPGQGGMGS